MKNIFLSLLIIFSNCVFAYDLPAKTLVAQSEQLVVVTTQNWQAINGQLQLFQRDPRTLQWPLVSPKIPVVVGKNGMGWGIDLQAYGYAGPIKAEKDLRTPAGVFKLGPVFGYPARPPLHLKMDYMSVNDTYFCNDHSGDEYNHLIYNKAAPIRSEWLDVEVLRWGVIIQYNTVNPIQNAGSCTFIHVWEGYGIGTRGCVGMSVQNVEYVTKWLDPTKNPLIVILPKKEYAKLQREWNLPPLTLRQGLMNRF